MTADPLKPDGGRADQGPTPEPLHELTFGRRAPSPVEAGPSHDSTSSGGDPRPTTPSTRSKAVAGSRPARRPGGRPSVSDGFEGRARRSRRTRPRWSGNSLEWADKLTTIASTGWRPRTARLPISRSSTTWAVASRLWPRRRRSCPGSLDAGRSSVHSPCWPRPSRRCVGRSRGSGPPTTPTSSRPTNGSGRPPPGIASSSSDTCGPTTWPTPPPGPTSWAASKRGPGATGRLVDSLVPWSRRSPTNRSPRSRRLAGSWGAGVSS